jgi:hypothetical protein
MASFLGDSDKPSNFLNFLDTLMLDRSSCVSIFVFRTGKFLFQTPNYYCLLLNTLNSPQNNAFCIHGLLPVLMPHS